MKKPTLYLLTGDSGSWKTFLWKYLKEKNIEECLSFTTREIREDDELDNYIFLTEDQWNFKNNYWDFLEINNYKWNFYSLSKYIPEWDCFAIVDPNGRKQILEENRVKSHNIKTIFIKTDRKILMSRLLKRDGNLARLDDKFTPTHNCLKVNWKDPVEANYKKITEWV